MSCVHSARIHRQKHSGLVVHLQIRDCQLHSLLDLDPVGLAGGALKQVALHPVLSPTIAASADNWELFDRQPAPGKPRVGGGDFKAETERVGLNVRQLADSQADAGDPAQCTPVDFGQHLADNGLGYGEFMHNVSSAPGGFVDGPALPSYEGNRHLSSSGAPHKCRLFISCTVCRATGPMILQKRGPIKGVPISVDNLPIASLMFGSRARNNRSSLSINKEDAMGEEMVMDPGSAGMLAAFGAAFWLFVIGLYVVFSYLQYRICKNAGVTENLWWAYVPILSLFLMLNAAGKPWWWFVLCLIPLVNIVALVMIWVEIAKNCGQSPVWGVLMILPLINIASFLVLAFSTPPRRNEPSRPAPRPRQPVPMH